MPNTAAEAAPKAKHGEGPDAQHSRREPQLSGAVPPLLIDAGAQHIKKNAGSAGNVEQASSLVADAANQGAATAAHEYEQAEQHRAPILFDGQPHRMQCGHVEPHIENVLCTSLHHLLPKSPSLACAHW